MTCSKNSQWPAWTSGLVSSEAPWPDSWLAGGNRAAGPPPTISRRLCSASHRAPYHICKWRKTQHPTVPYQKGAETTPPKPSSRTSRNSWQSHVGMIFSHLASKVNSHLAIESGHLCLIYLVKMADVPSKLINSEASGISAAVGPGLSSAVLRRSPKNHRGRAIVA